MEKNRSAHPWGLVVKLHLLAGKGSPAHIWDISGTPGTHLELLYTLGTHLWLQSPSGLGLTSDFWVLPGLTWDTWEHLGNSRKTCNVSSAFSLPIFYSLMTHFSHSLSGSDNAACKTKTCLTLEMVSQKQTVKTNHQESASGTGKEVKLLHNNTLPWFILNTCSPKQ